MVLGSSMQLHITLHMNVYSGLTAVCVNHISLSAQEYKEYHTDTEVHFQLFFTAAKLQEVLAGTGPHQKLKLVGKASIGNVLALR